METKIFIKIHSTGKVSECTNSVFWLLANFWLTFLVIWTISIQEMVFVLKISPWQRLGATMESWTPSVVAGQLINLLTFFFKKRKQTLKWITKYIHGFFTAVKSSCNSICYDMNCSVLSRPLYYNLMTSPLWWTMLSPLWWVMSSPLWWAISFLLWLAMSLLYSGICPPHYDGLCPWHYGGLCPWHYDRLCPSYYD